MKLSKLVNERWLKSPQERAQLSEDDKRTFLEAVGRFAEYGKSVYREHNLKDVVEEMAQMINMANKLTVSESEEWFDNITVGRHMKTLKENFKVFEKTANEISTLQQRLESAYDDIGGTLSKYYNIEGLEEKLDPVGGDNTDDDDEIEKEVPVGKVRDINNDGDVDDSDEYLANRRKTISKVIKK